MKILRWIGILFSLIGIGLLGGAYFSYQHTQGFLQVALTAEGTVIGLSRSEHSDYDTGGTTSFTYHPVVAFTAQNGERIELISSLGSNPPSYHKGDRVEVLYRPDDPQDAKISSFMNLWFVPVLLGGIGGVFLLVGLGMIIPTMIKRRTREKLRQTGTPIQTKLTQVTQNTSYSAGGRYPYRIVSQWQEPRTGKVHVFTSENIWFDPSDYLTGDDVTVYIERDNPDRYYVDISFLPKMAE